MTEFEKTVISSDTRRFRRVGPYRLIREIGRGGMGIVYEAIDEELDRPTAIKLIREDRFTSEELVLLARRQRREAKLAAQVSSSHIVSIYAAGEHDDRRYIAMELIDGSALDSVIDDRGSIESEVALNYIYQATLGLGQLHDHKILHRDIKPANLLLTGEGIIKVTDFGLALPVSPDGSQRDSQMAAGTLRYMSPEQARGESLDERSDIYSLGATLYSCLTGKSLTAASSLQELCEHFDKGMVLPRQGELNAPLEKLISRMAEPDPEKRFENCPALLDAVGDCCEELGFARPDAPTTTTIRSRIEGLLVGGITLLAALVFFGGLATVGGFPKESLSAAIYHSLNDAMFQALPSHNSNDALVVLGLEEWPIETAALGRLIEDVSAYTPSVIALDLLIDEKGSRLDNPEDLADAFSSAGNVILAQEMVDGRPLAPIPSLDAVLLGHGHVAVPDEFDSTIRSHQYSLLSDDGEVIPSLAGEAVSHHGGRELDIPNDDVALNFQGLEQVTVLRLSTETGLLDPVDETVRQLFDGRIVVVGTLLSDDQHRSPQFGGGREISGVEYQAVAIDNLLTNTFIAYPPRMLSILYWAILAAGCVLLCSRLRTRWAGLIWIGALAAHLLASAVAIRVTHMAFSSAPVILITLVAVLATTVVTHRRNSLQERV